jgi:hypothetical protein
MREIYQPVSQAISTIRPSRKSDEDGGSRSTIAATGLNGSVGRPILAA